MRPFILKHGRFGYFWKKFRKIFVCNLHDFVEI